MLPLNRLFNAFIFLIKLSNNTHVYCASHKHILKKCSIRRHNHQYCLILKHFYHPRRKPYTCSQRQPRIHLLYMDLGYIIFKRITSMWHLRYFSCGISSVTWINISLFLEVSYISLWTNCILYIYQFVNTWDASTCKICLWISMHFIVNWFLMHLYTQLWNCYIIWLASH